MLLSNKTVLFFIIQLLNMHQFIKITKERYYWTGNINTVNMTCEANTSWRVCVWEHVDSGKNCNIEWNNAKVYIPYEIKLFRNISVYIRLQTILGLLYRKRKRNSLCIKNILLERKITVFYQVFKALVQKVRSV